MSRHCHPLAQTLRKSLLLSRTINKISASAYACQQRPGDITNPNLIGRNGLRDSGTLLTSVRNFAPGQDGRGQVLFAAIPLREA